MTAFEKRAISLIHQWLYSRVRPGYYGTKFEYAASKYLLHKYICVVTNFIGSRNAENIHNTMMPFCCTKIIGYLVQISVSNLTKYMWPVKHP